MSTHESTQDAGQQFAEAMQGEHGDTVAMEAARRVAIALAEAALATAQLDAPDADDVCDPARQFLSVGFLTQQCQASPAEIRAAMKEMGAGFSMAINGVPYLDVAAANVVRAYFRIMRADFAEGLSPELVEKLRRHEAAAAVAKESN